MKPSSMSRWRGLIVFEICLLLISGAATWAQYPSAPQVTKDGTSIQLADYASLPLSSATTSTYPPPINFGSYLARVNFLRSEPVDAPLASSRFFVCDLNRNIYILDKSNRTFTPYINFEEVFRRFSNSSYAGGIVTFEFDPAYAANGKFYTSHIETNKNSFYNPVNTSLPGLNTNGYTTTPLYTPPGVPNPVWESVLIEWVDTNVSNATFEGTARELLRVGFYSMEHPIGDLAFNPSAHPGDADYRNLYIAIGDGGMGETTGSLHTVPQRLDVLQGKILRITPDLSLRPADELSANGRYRIPTTGADTNPFISLTLSGLKKEIYAYGFRNVHRFSWDAPGGKLIENDIGQHSWEEINFIVKGGNYGYAEREGMEQLFVGVNDGTTGSRRVPPVAFPNPDSLTVTGLMSSVTPMYPVATYSHWDGDAIASGFVYRGSLMPALYGKYIFADITTARLFYCDFEEMLAADDGNRLTLATIHELQVVFNGMKRRAFDLISQKYHQKGGTSANALPGGCGGLNTVGNDPEGVPYGCGRADVRLARGGDGELYLLSKSDGMIRQLSAVLIPPTLGAVTVTNGTRTITWPAISNRTYRVQYKTNLNDLGWSNLVGDITANSATASKTDSTVAVTRYYRLQVLP
jgi:hypothetical protein